MLTITFICETYTMFFNNFILHLVMHSLQKRSPNELHTRMYLFDTLKLITPYILHMWYIISGAVKAFPCLKNIYFKLYFTFIYFLIVGYIGGFFFTKYNNLSVIIFEDFILLTSYLWAFCTHSIKWDEEDK